MTHGEQAPPTPEREQHTINNDSSQLMGSLAVSCESSSYEDESALELLSIMSDYRPQRELVKSTNGYTREIARRANIAESKAIIEADNSVRRAAALSKRSKVVGVRVIKTSFKQDH